MANEREEMIGFLLTRIDERDKLIARLQQQLEEKQQTAPEAVPGNTIEHSSIMANKAAQ